MGFAFAFEFEFGRGRDRERGAARVGPAVEREREHEEKVGDSNAKVKLPGIDETHGEHNNGLRAVCVAEGVAEDIDARRSELGRTDTAGADERRGEEC